jgi:outer membrane receptor for ferrienterochelin and colicin
MVDNDGKVSLKGKQGVIIMIDGKPTYLNAADLANYLKNMPSNQLDQVEIMSQPPAKYDASGNSGVINLITKKNKNAGFNGSLTTSAIIAKYFKNTNSFNFNWHKGKINFYGTYGFSYWEGFSDINIDKSLRENANTAFDRYFSQYTFGRYSDRAQTFRAGIDFFANRKNTFGISVNGTIDRQSFTSSSTANLYDSLHLFVQYNIAKSQNSLFNIILRSRKIKHHRHTWASMPTGSTSWTTRAASCPSTPIIFSITPRVRPIPIITCIMPIIFLRKILIC